MATESSAIARFVNLAQSQAIHEPGQPEIAQMTQPVPPLELPPTPSVAPQTPETAPRASRSGLWLALLGVVVIGGSVAGGYVLAQQQGGAENLEGQSSLGGPAPSSASHEPPPAASAPKAAPALIQAEVEPAPVEPDPETAPAVDVELAKRTGFDIIVNPKGAQVSLDGHVIGAAPLRVRNLLPGAHGIDIEGPEGYFGRHLEFDLDAGEETVLELDLQPVDAESVQAKPLVTEVQTLDGQEEAKEEAEAVAQEKPAPARLSRKERRRAKRKARRAKQQADKKRPNAGKGRAALDGAEEVAMGTLMLGAKPPCEIYVNGRNTGLTTPQRSMQLPQGTHRVVLINREHEIRKSFKVKIKAGRTTRAIQDLSKKL